LSTDLPQFLAAIRERPDDGPRWLALARWLTDNGRDDEAAAVRVFWPTLRDNLAVGVAEVARSLRRAAAVRDAPGIVVLIHAVEAMSGSALTLAVVVEPRHHLSGLARSRTNKN
jgi:uncharacterized protein (TIGR02996 family)